MNTTESPLIARTATNNIIGTMHGFVHGTFFTEMRFESVETPLKSRLGNTIMIALWSYFELPHPARRRSRWMAEPSTPSGIPSAFRHQSAKTRCFCKLRRSSVFLFIQFRVISVPRSPAPAAPAVPPAAAPLPGRWCPCVFLCPQRTAPFLYCPGTYEGWA